MARCSETSPAAPRPRRLRATSEKPTPTPTPSTTPAGRTAPFPDLPFIVGTAAGDVYFALQGGDPSGPKVHICDGAVTTIATYGRQAAIVCGSGATRTLSVLDVDTGAARTIAEVDTQNVAFDGVGGLAYVALGEVVRSAPISKTKILLRDLRSGSTRTIDEAFGVAFDLRLTGAGVAVWRPKNSLSFVRSDADTGTWLIINGALVKFSQHRLVDGDQRGALLESEPANGSGGSTYVLWKAATELRLTPTNVANERAVMVTPDERAVAWRPKTSEFEGEMVIYHGTTVERTDAGLFSAFRPMVSGDWVVGLEYSGPPSLKLRAYRVSDGAFAGVTAGGITAIGMLGPKKGP